MDKFSAEVMRGDETHQWSAKSATNANHRAGYARRSPDIDSHGPALRTPIQITGLSALHHKECDRLECPAKELALMGVELSTTEDSINISSSSNHAEAAYIDHLPRPPHGYGLFAAGQYERHT